MVEIPLPISGKKIAKTLSYNHVLLLKRADYVLRLLFLSWLGKFIRVLFVTSNPARLVNPRRVLVIRPGGIGDAVILVPVLKKLRSSFPQAHIAVLAERRNAAVFRPLCGNIIDALFCYDRFRDFLSLLVCSFDVVIDTEQWHVLSAITASTVGRKAIRIGFATNERSMFFTHPVPYDNDGFEGDNFFRLLRPLDIDSTPPYPFACFYPVDRFSRQDKAKRVALFPGASIKERQWDPAKFREVAAWLRSRNIDVVIVGGREDVESSKIIASGLNDVENLAGRTSLEETAGVLASCDLVVASDSGIMHLAVAVGTPVVAFFGPGIESKWAPRDGISIVINKKFPCSPCTSFGYTAACSRNAQCIQEITVDEVLNAIKSILFREWELGTGEWELRRHEHKKY
ncbi:MAG: glycosyltransferase family 9 protein [Thermodesulforhabdaceae bacterium]